MNYSERRKTKKFVKNVAEGVVANICTSIALTAMHDAAYYTGWGVRITADKIKTLVKHETEGTEA